MCYQAILYYWCGHIDTSIPLAVCEDPNAPDHFVIQVTEQDDVRCAECISKAEAEAHGGEEKADPCGSK
jgi:hypothetical protein